MFSQLYTAINGNLENDFLKQKNPEVKCFAGRNHDKDPAILLGCPQIFFLKYVERGCVKNK